MTSTAADSLKPQQHRFPASLVWIVGCICCAPFLLILLGFDFGSHAPLDRAMLEKVSDDQFVHALHHVLRGSFTHTLLEWSAFCAAIMTAGLAGVHFWMRREDVATPIIGMSLFFAGTMDAFHTLAADRLIHGAADATNLVPFTWALCRLFSVLIMIIGVSLALGRWNRDRATSLSFVAAVSVLLGFLAYGTIHACTIANTLPKTMFPDSFISRPFDIAPLILFVLAGLTVYRLLHRRQPSYFSYALLVSLIPNVATQAHMAFGSTQLFDNHFNVAHFLKIIAYLVPLAGLILDYVATYQSQEIAVKEIAYRERELTDFFENASVGLHLVGPDGIILRANQSELDMLGYVREEYVGKHISEFHVDDDVIEDILKRLTTGETLHNYHARLRCKDGSIKQVLINSNVYWENGVFTHTRCFTRDITARKQAEDELRGSEARMRAILDTAADAIITIDAHGRIQSLNPAAEEMFGYTAQEILQENVSRLMPSPYSDQHDSYLANYLRTGQKKIIGIGREVIGLRKDGTTFPLELAVSEVQQDGLCLFTGIVRDISERKQAENELKEYSQNLEKTHSQLATQAKEMTQKAAELAVAQEELQRANKAKSEFLANMSHELRTPLNAVIGFSEGLIERRDRHPLNDHQMDRLSKINKSGQHLLSLISDILDISKVESGKLEVHSSSFDVCVMATEVADVAEGLCRDKSLVSFRLEIDENLPTLTSDRERIKQVLINLVGNAMKFTEQGQIILRIRYAGNHFLMSVQDTGIGIPAKQCDKVFDKFHQIRDASTSSIKGTGLGLAICKAFADLIGATLSVESAVGVGSTFTLSVPEKFFAGERSHLEIQDENLVTS